MNKDFRTSASRTFGVGDSAEVYEVESCDKKTEAMYQVASVSNQRRKTMKMRLFFYLG